MHPTVAIVLALASSSPAGSDAAVRQYRGDITGALQAHRSRPRFIARGCCRALKRFVSAEDREMRALVEERVATVYRNGAWMDAPWFCSEGNDWLDEAGYPLAERKRLVAPLKKLYLNAYLGMLRTDGAMVLMGAPPEAADVSAFSLIMGRKTLAGSLIGGIAETQEMLDFCAEKKLGADVEVIPIQKINEAYERMLKGDVRYRFSIDCATL